MYQPQEESPGEARGAGHMPEAWGHQAVPASSERLLQWCLEKKTSEAKSTWSVAWKKIADKTTVYKAKNVTIRRNKKQALNLSKYQKENIWKKIKKKTGYITKNLKNEQIRSIRNEKKMKKMTKQRTNMNVLFVTTNEIKTPIKAKVWISDCFKSNGKLYAVDRTSKTKYQRRMKNKKMVEHLSGKCSKKKAEVNLSIGWGWI